MESLALSASRQAYHSGCHHQPQALPQVGVAPAALALGQAAQAGGGIDISDSARCFGRSGLRQKQQVAVFGHEQEDQPVDQAQQLAVIVLAVELAAFQLLAQRLVGRMRQKALAQG